MKIKPLCTLPFLIGLTITSLLLASCGIFVSDDDSVDFNPNFVCTNAASGEWTYLGIGEEAVKTIAINPGNSAHIIAGTAQDFSAEIQGKIFRSTDCGAYHQLNQWIVLIERRIS